MPSVGFCRRCHEPLPIVGQVPAICPHCESRAGWTFELAVYADPQVPWELNWNDYRFLRSLRIDAEFPFKVG